MLQIECEWMDRIYVNDFFYSFFLLFLLFSWVVAVFYRTFFFHSFSPSFQYISLLYPSRLHYLFHFSLRGSNFCKMSIYIHDMYMQLVLSCFICLFSSHSNRSFVPSTFCWFKTFFFFLVLFIFLLCSALRILYTSHETPDYTEMRFIAFVLLLFHCFRLQYTICTMHTYATQYVQRTHELVDPFYKKKTVIVVVVPFSYFILILTKDHFPFRPSSCLCIPFAMWVKRFGDVNGVFGASHVFE